MLTSTLLRLSSATSNRYWQHCEKMCNWKYPYLSASSLLWATLPTEVLAPPSFIISRRQAWELMPRWKVLKSQRGSGHLEEERRTKMSPMYGSIVNNTYTKRRKSMHLTVHRVLRGRTAQQSLDLSIVTSKWSSNPRHPGWCSKPNFLYKMKAEVWPSPLICKRAIRMVRIEANGRKSLTMRYATWKYKTAKAR